MELSLFLIILCMYGTSAVSIVPELKCNVLRFGYGVNLRYEGIVKVQNVCYGADMLCYPERGVDIFGLLLIL